MRAAAIGADWRVLLADDEPAGTTVERFDRDIETIVQSCGLQEVDLGAVHGKRNAVSRSSAEAESRAIRATPCARAP